MLSCKACKLEAEGGLVEFVACLSIKASMDRLEGTIKDEWAVWR